MSRAPQVRKVTVAGRRLAPANSGQLVQLPKTTAAVGKKPRPSRHRAGVSPWCLRPVSLALALAPGSMPGRTGSGTSSTAGRARSRPSLGVGPRDPSEQLLDPRPHPVALPSSHRRAHGNSCRPTSWPGAATGTVTAPASRHWTAGHRQTAPSPPPRCRGWRRPIGTGANQATSHTPLGYLTSRVDHTRVSPWRQAVLPQVPLPGAVPTTAR